MPEHNSVPGSGRDDPPTGAGSSAVEKVLDAVRAHPGATSAQIAHAARVSRSAAAKALAGLARESRITRTPGIRAGGNRAPDQWHPAAPDSSAAAETDPADDQHPSTDAQPAAPQKSTKTTSKKAERPNRTADADKAARGAPGRGKAAKRTVTKGTVAKGTAPKATAAKEPGAKEPGETDPDAAQESPGQRLKPGALRGLVEQYLADHPEQDYTPTALGHLLGRSSGAIANALEKLVADKYAVLVSRKPRSYRSAPPE